MNGLHPVFQAIIKEKLPVPYRKSERRLLREVSSQKNNISSDLQGVKVTVIYEAENGIKSKMMYVCGNLLIEHRLLIDAVFTDYSLCKKIKALTQELRAHQSMLKRPRTQ